MFLRPLLSVFCVSYVLSAYGGNSVILIDEEKHVATPACAAFGTCDVKEIGFWTHRYRVGPKDETDLYDQSYGTSLYAWYETGSFDTLEDYVFVQYIHGCVFRSRSTSLGSELHHGMVRNHLDPTKTKAFIHPEWTVDSDDKDPAYNTHISHPDERHFFMQWNDNEGKFPERRGNFYGTMLPPKPRLYTTDLPTQAMASVYYDGSIWAINVSLEFRMCLYREKDVPKEAAVDTRIMAEPLACFDWRSSAVYNHEMKRFDTPTTIVPECTQMAALPRRSAKGETLP